MNKVQFTKLIEKHYDTIIEGMKEIEKEACEYPALSFCLAITPEGKIYNWYHSDSYSEPEDVWNGTDKVLYRVSDPTQSWYDAYAEGAEEPFDEEDAIIWAVEEASEYYYEVLQEVVNNYEEDY